ncbi:MAG: hypothetical protein OJF51_000905 [Nitrospira sp.]|nr:MAG: hypothetical protein OJF51_000905 [Nitrospira sp.]
MRLISERLSWRFGVRMNPETYTLGHTKNATDFMSQRSLNKWPSA